MRAIMIVEPVIAQCSPLFRGDRVVIAPNIPPRKLNGALSTYGLGFGAKPADVLLLVDTTLFGSAGDGFMVTRTHLLAHDIATTPVGFELASLRFFVFNRGLVKVDVVVNGVHFVTLSCVEKDERQGLERMLQMLVEAVVGAGAEAPAPARQTSAGPWNCPNCGASATGDDLCCAYCGTSRI